MEIFEFNYGWDKVRARLTKGGGVYVDLPSRSGQRGSTYRESIVLEDRGWRFSSTQDDCIEYYFHVWLTDRGMVSWTNDLKNRIEYLSEPFDPDHPNAGLINDTVLKIHTIAKKIRDYQKRNLPVAEVFELRKYYLDTTLKMLGYDSIDAVGEKLDVSRGYLALSKVAKSLEKYKNLATAVYSTGKAGDYDCYISKFLDEVTRDDVIEYIRPIKEEVDSNIAFMREQEESLELKRKVCPEYRRDMNKKMGLYTWDDYEENVKKVAMLLLELNADLLTPEQRVKFGIPEFVRIEKLETDDKIARLIDTKSFNDACNVEDELVYQESKQLVGRLKEIDPEIVSTEESIPREKIVQLLASELKDIEERKDSISIHENIYKKYYSKARKVNSKVQEDDYVL